MAAQLWLKKASSTNPACLFLPRSLWEQGGEKSKSSALRTAAIKNADGISEGLLKLAEQLEQYAADPTNEPMLSLVLQIAKKCPGACDVLDACKSSDDTEAKGKTEMISAGIEKVRRILESSYNGSTSFGDSLDTFWVDELYLKQPDNATATLTVFFRNLMIEGRWLFIFLLTWGKFGGTRYTCVFYPRRI